MANRVSNILNSTCQNNSTSKVDGVNIEIIGSRVGGNVSENSQGNISKSQCVISNTARTTLSNDQSNSQTAKTMQGSPLLFAIIAIVIVVVVIMIGIVIIGVGGLGGLALLKGGKKPKKKGVPPVMPPGRRPPPRRMPPNMRPRVR